MTALAWYSVFYPLLTFLAFATLIASLCPNELGTYWAYPVPIITL